MLRLTRPAGGGALALEAGGTDLPVGLAAALPLALAGRAGDAGHLATLEPRGTLERWSATLRAGEGLAGLDLAARAVGLATSAAGPLPGIDALDAELVLERGRGTLALAPASPDGVRVDAPRIDADRLVVDALDARLEVDLRPAGATALRVRGPVALETRGLDLSARLGLAAAPGRSPRLDLSARFALDEAAAAAGFLPDRLLAAGTVARFETALRSGRARERRAAGLRPARRLPVRDGSGVFRASADVRDLTLDWLPGWPVARGVSGTVRVDGASVSGDVRAGRAAGLELSTGEWRIADVRRPGLALELAGAGTLPAMLDFATNGPLAATLEPALGDVAGVGEAGLDLAVSVPLSGAAARRDGPLAVDGTVFLAGNDVRFGRGARGARGRRRRGVVRRGGLSRAPAARRLARPAPRGGCGDDGRGRGARGPRDGARRARGGGRARPLRDPARRLRRRRLGLARRARRPVRRIDPRAHRRHAPGDERSRRHGAGAARAARQGTRPGAALRPRHRVLPGRRGRALDGAGRGRARRPRRHGGGGPRGARARARRRRGERRRRAGRAHRRRRRRAAARRLGRGARRADRLAAGR